MKEKHLFAFAIGSQHSEGKFELARNVKWLHGSFPAHNGHPNLRFPISWTIVCVDFFEKQGWH